MNDLVRKYKYEIYLLFFTLLILGLRLGHVSQEEYGLFFDESQYWFWSLDFDWGYYSKPPMVAWIIGLGTNICESEFCIRMSSSILHVFTAANIFFIASKLYNKKTAYYCGLCFITLPAVTLSSYIVSTDPSLLFFWSLALLFYVYAIKTDKTSWWVLAGIAAGLGMLSKYNMLMFLFGVLLHGFLVGRFLDTLKNKNFWIASIIALLIFIPNVVWNYNNDFVSFMHTKANANLSGDMFHVKQLAEFFFAQFGVFSPILFFFLAYIVVSFTKNLKNEESKLLVSFFLPLFALILLISFLSRAHANWAAPAYVSATILVVSYLISSGKKWAVYLTLIINLSLLLGFMHFNSVIESLNIELTGKKINVLERKIKDPFLRLKKARSLNHEVDKLLNKYSERNNIENLALLTCTRKTHANLIYYQRNRNIEIIKWNPTRKKGDYFDMVTDINNSKAKNFFMICKPGMFNQVKDHFKIAKKKQPIIIKYYDDYEELYNVYYFNSYIKEQSR